MPAGSVAPSLRSTLLGEAGGGTRLSGLLRGFLRTEHPSPEDAEGGWVFGFFVAEATLWQELPRKERDDGYSYCTCWGDL
jgi:hypothetical protein